MLQLEIKFNDIMFCVKSLKSRIDDGCLILWYVEALVPLVQNWMKLWILKEPEDSFNIHNFIQFCTSGTRASTYHKMRQPSSMHTNTVRHFYFNRLPHLWNSLPFIDIEHPLSSIKQTLNSHFWDHFLANFNPDFPCTYHFLCPCAKCVSIPVSNCYVF